MKYIVNAAQMRAIDKYSIKIIGISSLVLMEKAAMAVVDTMLKKITKTDKILAVCGMGNNGGDGVAVARILYHLGYKADILLLGEEGSASESMKDQLNIAKNIGVNIFNQLEFDEYNIIVDAIFGIGLSKEITGNYALAINKINRLKNRVYSVDIPSGISADNGKIMNTAIKANETITFGFYKLGLLLFPGCEYAGNITVSDIGFPSISLEQIQPEHFTYTKEDLVRIPLRFDYSNKGTYGKVLIIAGSQNVSGACYLSAKAAYRAGAGLVKVMTVKENRNIMQTLLPEALLYTYDTMTLNDTEQIDRIKEEITWATTIVIGPGIGQSEESSQLLRMVLQHSKVPTIIDADAINLIALDEEYRMIKKDDDYGYNVNLPSNVILTPHLKEMSRLMHCQVTEVVDNLLPIATWATKDTDYILVLKDARTIITTKGKVFVNMSGNNGMATGGSGDVLTGIIAAFLAGGMVLFDAATMGVYVHGLAGDAAAEDKGVYSLIASDIIEALPKIVGI